jgi:hypothetical protein
VPRDGSLKPAMMRSAVDLPQPTVRAATGTRRRARRGRVRRAPAGRCRTACRRRAGKRIGAEGEAAIETISAVRARSETPPSA